MSPRWGGLFSERYARCATDMAVLRLLESVILCLVFSASRTTPRLQEVLDKCSLSN